MSSSLLLNRHGQQNYDFFLSEGSLYLNQRLRPFQNIRHVKGDLQVRLTTLYTVDPRYLEIEGTL